jgi:hypothetical protein
LKSAIRYRHAAARFGAWQNENCKNDDGTGLPCLRGPKVVSAR